MNEEDIAKIQHLSAKFQELNKKIKIIGLISKAKEEYNNYDYKNGLKDLELAYSIDKNNPTILRGIGCIKQHNKEYDIALKYFTKALQYSTSQEIEYTLIGMLYYIQDDLDNAIINFNKAIDINEDYDSAYEGRNQAMLENHIKILDLQESLKKYF